MTTAFELISNGELISMRERRIFIIDLPENAEDINFPILLNILVHSNSNSIMTGILNVGF